MQPEGGVGRNERVLGKVRVGEFCCASRPWSFLQRVSQLLTGGTVTCFVLPAGVEMTSYSDLCLGSLTTSLLSSIFHVANTWSGFCLAGWALADAFELLLAVRMMMMMLITTHSLIYSLTYYKAVTQLL